LLLYRVADEFVPGKLSDSVKNKMVIWRSLFSFSFNSSFEAYSFSWYSVGHANHRMGDALVGSLVIHSVVDYMLFYTVLFYLHHYEVWTVCHELVKRMQYTLGYKVATALMKCIQVDTVSACVDRHFFMREAAPFTASP
jgi:hypothetical protein